jgi:hypothetical protein
MNPSTSCPAKDLLGQAGQVRQEGNEGFQEKKGNSPKADKCPTPTVKCKSFS